ncbi:hypothetical protein PDE_01920 [Penicillium oxalicum 114-2]|uniref:Uncharacterized protein n=1 Tax=Penicillium oxalicum (strain 114-2 / CGMCC 5302) TaxID=933388 RepID=S7Z8R2_PENO1|nr:hypothetical protein PDE_01920 [Penicillium oxalicum 114-2]
MISPANLEFMLPSGQVCSTMAQAAKRAPTGLNNASGPSRRLELGDDEDHHNHHPSVQTRTGPLHRDGLGVVVAWSSVVNDESLGSWAQVTKMNPSPRYRPIQCRKVETGLRDGAINGHWAISHGFTCVSLLVQRGRPITPEPAWNQPNKVHLHLHAVWAVGESSRIVSRPFLFPIGGPSDSVFLSTVSSFQLAPLYTTPDSDGPLLQNPSSDLRPSISDSAL